jgi:hypothetical protein
VNESGKHEKGERHHLVKEERVAPDRAQALRPAVHVAHVLCDLVLVRLFHGVIFSKLTEENNEQKTEKKRKQSEEGKQACERREVVNAR